ncbi:MAG TPA: prepilin-type N-terminal cleavage/methylation domain-containing protein [Oceanipulchritudo sp.]|nr:prepilin-type N-terminal cleavage/methylation domain-containing protein [Oceanipulchritudo sp.]
METGNNVRRGFTLIEIIIVIALMALMGGLIVINAQAILRGLGDEPVERILLKAVREGRFQAAYLKEPTQLRYDEERASFDIHTVNGRGLAAFPTGMEDSDSRLEVLFEQVLPDRGLFRSNTRETAEIPAVTFRPDRSSTPFQVRIEYGSVDFTQRFDPFSDIVIHDSRSD